MLDLLHEGTTYWNLEFSPKASGSTVPFSKSNVMLSCAIFYWRNTFGIVYGDRKRLCDIAMLHSEIFGELDIRQVMFSL